MSTIACAVSLAPRAVAQDDFATDGQAWNSVSELIRIAQAREIAVAIPSRLDVGELQPSDALLILSPRDELPAAELTAFLHAGGRACLADDFGEGDSLLRVFRIGRDRANPEIAMALRGNPELLVARPVGNHRLTRQVPALVSNHPAVVYHQGLSPIFELGEGEALVLAGAVGPGRLVVLSDPSLLIDNMLQLQGNRRFAQNLVEYLAESGGGTLYVVGPGARVVGRFGEPGADRPLHDLRAALETLASLDLPPPALRIAALALAAIGVILTLGVLPRRSPYRSSRMFARPPSQGGFLGRVAFYARQKVDLLQPLMVYKFELEDEILRALSLRSRALLRDVLEAMRRRGMSESEVNDMRELLLELDRLHGLLDQPPAPPQISGRRFRELVAKGDGLLASIARSQPRGEASP